jgi:hypothetical protein
MAVAAVQDLAQDLVLQENIGNYVIVEFLIGTGSLISRQGVLYNVASQFLVLYDEFEARYVVCDIFSVKFVTFLLPGYRPGQIPAATYPSQPDAVPTFAVDAPARSAADLPAYAAPSPAQAAYAYTARRAAGPRQ